MLTDDEAVNLRGSVLDLVDRHNSLDDFEKDALRVSQKQLMQYERNVISEKRVPYQQSPRVTLNNLKSFEDTLNGDSEVFGEGVDTPNLVADTVGVSYLSSKFKSPVEEVYSNLEGYKKGLMDFHKTDNFESALRKDIETSRERITLVNETYEHAFRKAVTTDSLVDAFTEFSTEKGGELPKETIEFYGAALEEARIAFDENKDDFDALLGSMQKAIDDVEVIEQDNFFNAVAQLSRIEPKMRGLAFTYLEEKMKGDGSIKKVFEGRMGQLLRGMSNMTPAEISAQARGIIHTVENSNFDIPLAVIDGVQQDNISVEAQAAFRVATQTAGREMAVLPFWRKATPEEVSARYEDAQTAGKFARALMDVESYVQGTLANEDGFDSEILNKLSEKIIYPAVRMAPDMLLFIGASTMGKGMGNKAGKTFGVNAKMTGDIAAASLSLKAMAPTLKTEHYQKFIQGNPDIDEGAAYEMANVSGNTAAVLETLSMSLIMSRLPGVKNLMKNWRGGNFKSPTVAFLATTAGSVGAETVTELAQDFTADLTQEVFGAFDESIPEAHLLEAFGETIKQAPDIALAILPYALLGGGNSAYVSVQTQKSLLSNSDALKMFGFEQADIDEIFSAETLDQQVELFEKKYSIEKATAALNQSIAEGKDISDFISEEDKALLEGVSEDSQTREEPVVNIEKNEDGEIAQITVTTPEGESTSFDKHNDALKYVSSWYQQNGVEGLIMPDDQGGKHEAREQVNNEAPVTENSFAPENDTPAETEGMSFQEKGMPNPGRRVLADPVKTATKTGTKMPIVNDAPINSVQIIDALSNVIRATGMSGAIRTGRLRGRNTKNTLGQFWVREQIIRVRTANDVETSTHEAAHALEDGLFGASFRWKDDNTVPANAKKELIKLGQALYPKEPGNGWDSEGFAEFFRLYITDPQQAQEKAPGFTNHFQKFVSSIPELEKRIADTQQLATTFMQQGSFKRVRANIADQPSKKDVAKDVAKRTAQDFERQFIESASAVRKFVEEAKSKGAQIDESNDPMFTLTARRMTADSVVDYMVREGMLNFNGQKVGRSLIDVFKIVKGVEQDFIVYLYAKRAMALYDEGKGRNPGITKEDAQQVIEELETNQFKQAAQQFYDWHNGVLDYAAEASPDYAQAVKKMRKVDPGFYIPLQREFDAVTKRYLQSGGGVKGKDLSKRLKGSGRRIVDPVESSLSNAKAIVQKAHQKRILDQMTRIVDNTPGLGHLMVEVKRDMLPTMSRDIESMLKDVTKQIEDVGGKVDVSLPEAVSLDEEMMTFFAPAVIPQNKGDNPIMPIYSGGKLRWFEMDRGLFEAFNGMDMTKMHPAWDLVLGVPARTFRLGTTGLNAGFSLVTNPLRDFRTLQLNSQASASTGELFVNWLGSIKDLAMYAITNGNYRNKWIDLFKRLGVQMAQPLGQDTKPLQRAARRVKSGGKFTFFDTTDYIREIFQFTESAARIAEIKAVAKDIGYDFKQPLTAKIAAQLANAGKQVTTDFTQAGKLARQVNQAVPFFNAAIQGPVSHARALLRDPKKFAMRGLMGTALVLANWYRNKDEEWWKEMSLEERYAYTYIPVGDELIRVPRAFEADGLFMAGAEALADAWYQEEPEEAVKWFSKWLGGFIPTPVPVLPKLAAEQLANKNFFFDSPIVPRSQQDLFAEEQFSPYTTKVAIGLGDIFNVSPRRIEHGIRSIFGGVAIDVLALLGRGDGDLVEKEFEPANIPALGRLFQRGGQQARNPESVEQLYKQYSEAIKIQRSDKIEESNEHKGKRLLLMDGVRSVSFLSDIMHQTKSRKKRQEIESLIIEISKDAVNQELTRAEIKKKAKKFKKENQK